MAYVLIVLALAIVSLYTSISGVVKAEMFPPEVRALSVGFAYAIAMPCSAGRYVALWFKDYGLESSFFWYVTILRDRVARRDHDAGPQGEGIFARTRRIRTDCCHIPSAHAAYQAAPLTYLEPAVSGFTPAIHGVTADASAAAASSDKATARGEIRHIHSTTVQTIRMKQHRAVLLRSSWATSPGTAASCRLTRTGTCARVKRIEARSDRTDDRHGASRPVGAKLAGDGSYRDLRQSG